MTEAPRPAPPAPAAQQASRRLPPNLLIRALHDLGELLILAARHLDRARRQTHEDAILAATPAGRRAPAAATPAVDTQIQTYTITETYESPIQWPPDPGGTSPGGGTPGGGGGGSDSGSGGSPAPTIARVDVTVPKQYASCAEAKGDLLLSDGSPGHPFATSTKWNLNFRSVGGKNITLDCPQGG